MTASTAHRIVSLLVLLALLIQPLSVTAAYPAAEAAGPTVQATHQVDPEAPGFLFRATVTLAGSRNLARLEKTGVLVLRTVEGDGTQSALVLADGDQLADLARLGFKPRAADELRLLVNAQGPQKQWLAESLAPLLAQADAAAQQWATAGQQAAEEVAGASGAAATPDALALQALRTSLRALSPEQIAGTADSVSVDDDADGLTNTQEQWWCTDPLDADTDDDGRIDGAEIQALKDWLGNKRESAPGETPWPSWPFNSTTCPDKDHDSIPNLAEQWELGLNMDLESSDRDKFDDGQELFGVTYCPGGDLSCGYGDLPRSADRGYVGAAMPSWVKAPGKHPLVAAFPVPEVDVVESSLKVRTVTDVTTDHVIASGTEKSYSTAKTEGTSTSVADTTTWNDWQEVSITTPMGRALAIELDPVLASANPDSPDDLSKFLKVAGATAVVAAGACEVFSIGFCTPIAAPLALVGGAASLVGELIDTGPAPTVINNDYIQNFGQLNVCRAESGSAVSCANKSAVEQSSQQVVSLQSVTIQGQDRVPGGNGAQYGINSQSHVTAQPSYQIVVPTNRPVPTKTVSSGKSWGGAQTTTSEQYEEQTVTDGGAFSNEESWGTATAVNSAHAADLWFTYNVRNAGTEYAREIADLAFNVYIGDDLNPVYTYFVGPDLGGDGKFHNFMPTEEHTYTARHIPLTLEQMRAVDLGGPIRVVVEDFTYGADELFYQDAANAGVLLAIEDGTDDGDEAIDTYLIPTWGEETVLDVLGRYFPHETDADGMMTSVWTPEYRADAPAWCIEPVRTGNTLWCKHALSTSDWWNIYTNGMGDGSEGFQDTLTAPGETALFRFNKDSDLDGYSDRSEARLGTDPNDPSSFPRPELLAGVHSIRNGSDVVATLSLLNSGLYDAYGVEAVMIAPDDTTSITNNTVGGSGRVRAQKQVIVGSRILAESPLPAAWTQAGHAQPAPGGYYTGNTDRTYTFTVDCSSPAGCDVGSGTWSLVWNDGNGATGSLGLGDGYLSPTLLDIGVYGLKLGLLSGKAYNGDSFTVEARTPRDTFKYTIAAGHEDDFTPPIVLVSYNDPQGNHRFVVPADAMELASPTDNLMTFSGQMLMEPGVEIVTSGPFSTGANTTDLVVNNPTQTQVTDAHLFLEFIDPQGVVVSEVPVTVNLPAGPNVVPVAWDSGSFDPPYDPVEDYIVMAFWTDYQGNILDTAARPLSSFQEDPKPAFIMAAEDETWDFGTAQQGTLMQRQVTLASVGYGDLLTHMSNATGMSVEGPADGAGLLPGDTGAYTLTLNTQYLPVGPFEETLEIRTNDPTNPTKTITIRGDVTRCRRTRPAARRSDRWMYQLRFLATRVIG